ncbi:purine permease [Clostridium swellfunianum]|uniref:uracil-xanthine permease family protein n=1 Tax=Clostridium swellfunianum TaxID=1367462 RepID=UPI002030627B|nr:nucleobase:cation symporter-2 family protein [Clostridium swellfunianum]MCM0648999.1 purine permease [Clostridium swellfunianum]
MDKRVYELNGIPAFKDSLIFGFQHVVAMFVGNIAPVIIVCNALKLPMETQIKMIQLAMFVAGVATLFQLYPIGPIGTKLPIVMGTSFTFVPTAIAIGAKYNFASVMGACFVCGLVIAFFGLFLKSFRKYFSPVVIGTVVLSIGLSLLPVGINYFAGGQGAKDFGSPSNLLLGFIVLLVVLYFSMFIKGGASSAAILIGILVGYIVAIPMGKLDISQVASAGWVSVPIPFEFGLEFHADAIISMLIVFAISSMETIGNISAIALGGLNREITDKELSGGVIADAVGSSFAAIFGVLPNSAFGQNVSIITMTKVVNRFSIATGAGILILGGLFPKVGSIIAIMPSSVLGGAAIIMFAMIVIAGVKMITIETLDNRSSMIVAIALGLGFGVGMVPGVLDVFPQWAKMVFGSSGVANAGMLAFILNIILPKVSKSEDMELTGLEDVVNL